MKIKFIKEFKAIILLTALLSPVAFGSVDVPTEETSTPTATAAPTAPNINILNNVNSTRLLKTFRNDDLASAKALCDPDNSVQLYKEDVSQALCIAVKFGKSDYIELFLARSGYLGITPEMWKNAFISAIEKGLSEESEPFLLTSPIARFISSQDDLDDVFYCAARCACIPIIERLTQLPGDFYPSQDILNAALDISCGLSRWNPNQSRTLACLLNLTIGPDEETISKILNGPYERTSQFLKSGLERKKNERMRERYRALFLSGKDCGSTNNIIYRLPIDLAKAVAQYI